MEATGLPRFGLALILHFINPLWNLSNLSSGFMKTLVLLPLVISQDARPGVIDGLPCVVTEMP